MQYAGGFAADARSMAGVSYADKGPFSGVSGSNLIICGLNSETLAGVPAAASPTIGFTIGYSFKGR